MDKGLFVPLSQFLPPSPLRPFVVDFETMLSLETDNTLPQSQVREAEPIYDITPFTAHLFNSSCHVHV